MRLTFLHVFILFQTLQENFHAAEIHWISVAAISSVTDYNTSNSGKENNTDLVILQCFLVQLKVTSKLFSKTVIWDFCWLRFRTSIGLYDLEFCALCVAFSMMWSLKVLLQCFQFSSGREHPSGEEFTYRQHCKEVKKSIF